MLLSTVHISWRHAALAVRFRHLFTLPKPTLLSPLLFFLILRARQRVDADGLDPGLRMSAQLFPVCKTRFPSRILPAAPFALARGKTAIGATLPDDSSDRGGKRENEEKTRPLPNKSEGAEVEPDDDLSDGGRGLSSEAQAGEEFALSPTRARIPGGSPSGQANVSTRLGLVTWWVY